MWIILKQDDSKWWQWVLFTLIWIRLNKRVVNEVSSTHGVHNSALVNVYNSVCMQHNTVRSTLYSMQYCDWVDVKDSKSLFCAPISFPGFAIYSGKRKLSYQHKRRSQIAISNRLFGLFNLLNHIYSIFK